MADFDSFDYDIESRLPEWWKGFGALEPINKYTQELIAEILQGLLTTMGVVQPLNCWLSIPEEYNWYHHYKATDDYLKDEQGNVIITDKAVTTLFKANKIHAQIPNTKRNCDARIKLKLLGREINDTKNTSEIIDELTIQNADQIIKIHNIPSVSTIEISTKDNEILIDGESNPNIIEGKIHKIKPTIKNDDYIERYIDDNGDIQEEPIDIENENKKTEIIFHSTTTVNFDLQIYLYKPTYTTEQNIRIASVSAFPIEWVRLYGYFCHPFNNKAGYKYLWEKQYTEESRTTYDRITKQYDCERFYIQVKFYGIGTPLTKGFPQEYEGTNATFFPNPNLDKWGKIYGLPRRIYKTDITEDEEPYTFPKYYTYPIEQDYWYEERMVNEYRFDEDAINSMFIKDDNYKNVGILECIYPFMNDIWVYTETVDADSDTIHQIKNEDGNKIPLCSAIETDSHLGVSWDKPQDLLSKPILISLNPQTDDVLKQNDFSYQTKPLKMSFCLSNFDETTPKNITITGIELKLKTKTELQSKTIRLSEDSNVIIPYPAPFTSENQDNYILEKINLFHDSDTWLKNDEYYTIGGKNNLFGEKQITREQLFKGNNGTLDFELTFINENNFLQSNLYIEDAFLNVYYEIIENEYSIDVEFDKRTIDLREEDHEIKMQINIANKGKIEVHDKNLIIVVPPEISIKSGYKSYTFNLNIDEVCPPIELILEPSKVVNTNFNMNNNAIFDSEEELIFPENNIEDNEEQETPSSIIDFDTGWYDILVICEDKVISNEILVRGKTI